MRSCSTPWPTTSWIRAIIEFTHELVDIETLNRRAFEAELELTAVSIHAYAYLHDKYVLCTCGASMGDGYGPMVVAREAMSDRANCAIVTIAVPGKLTSAYLALRLCLRVDFKCVEVPFDRDHSRGRRRRISRASRSMRA